MGPSHVNTQVQIYNLLHCWKLHLPQGMKGEMSEFILSDAELIWMLTEKFKLNSIIHFGEIMKCLQRQYIFHYLNTNECSKISEQTNKKQMLKTICRPSALCSSSVTNEEWGKGCALFLGFLK